MELPQTKFQLGDDLYQVEGLTCAPFKVTAINYIALTDGKVNHQYLCEDAVSRKCIRQVEEKLFKTWEEAQAFMKETLQAMYDHAMKQIEVAVDPYKLPEEPTAKTPITK